MFQQISMRSEKREGHPITDKVDSFEGYFDRYDQFFLMQAANGQHAHLCEKYREIKCRMYEETLDIHAGNLLPAFRNVLKLDALSCKLLSVV